MHTFYNVNKLSLDKKKEIIQYAKDNCYEWRVDILTGIARQKIDMSYEDIMKKFTNDAHFTVICRYNPFDNSNYGEVSFRTMELIDYFLWIYLDIDKLTELINKFNLKTN